MAQLRTRTWLLFGVACLGASWMATAQVPAGQKSPAAAVDPRAAIAAKIPGAKPDDLRESPIPGVYEFTQGAEIAYVSSDGKYAIDGDLIEIASRDNLTEKTRRTERAKLINAVPESQMVIFSPKEAETAEGRH